MSEKRTKTRIFESPLKYDREKDEFYFIRTTETFEFDMVLHQWKIAKKEDTKHSVTERGTVKEAKMRIIFKRENVDRTTLRTMYGLFVQNIVFKIPSLKEFKHIWLKVSNKKVYLENFLEGTTQEIFIDVPLKEWTSDYFERIGKATRITEKQAIALLKEPDVYAIVFLEDENGILSRNALYSIKI